MSSPEIVKLCAACGSAQVENYCSHCGQAYAVKRITLKGLLHDVFHLFTHLDKGFAYTVKQLFIAPGIMQRRYVGGDRSRHQKPFSMFFICATIAAVSRYWIYSALMRYYDAGDASEVSFFHEYMVLLHMVMLPVYACISYAFFFRSKYNFAEMGVLLLYAVSAFFLIATAISLLKFIWPSMDTAYIELPVIVLYNIISFVNFYNTSSKVLTAIKAIAATVITFLSAHYAEELFIELLK